MSVPGTATEAAAFHSQLTPVTRTSAQRTEPAGRDADSMLQVLLQMLPRVNPQVLLQVTSQSGQQWWLRLDTAQVFGSALVVTIDPAAPAPRFAVVPHGAVPADPARAMPLDQWVYWLGRHTRGDMLYGYSDSHRLSVQRGVASPTHGRDFARLMVAYATPLTLSEAVARARCEPAVVRRFLNASTVLGRVRVQSAGGGTSSSTVNVQAVPAAPEQPQPASGDAPVRGLFGRLLHRLRGRP